MRRHPMSGAGRIKFDGSNEGTLVEVKTARKSYRVDIAYVNELYRVAVRQGKEPLLVIEFSDIPMVLECSIRRT